MEMATEALQMDMLATTEDEAPTSMDLEVKSMATLTSLRLSLGKGIVDLDNNGMGNLVGVSEVVILVSRGMKKEIDPLAKLISIILDLKRNFPVPTCCQKAKA